LITSSQMRAGRTLLRWSARNLSDASGVAISTVKRLELMEGVPQGTVKTLTALKSALEDAGISFIGDLETNPGVQLDTKKHQAYLDSLK
jgi:hypothetical protein